MSQRAAGFVALPPTDLKCGKGQMVRLVAQFHNTDRYMAAPREHRYIMELRNSQRNVRLDFVAPHAPPSLFPPSEQL